MSIVPIPSTRVSNLALGQRLIGQLQSDQLQLLRLQSAISSGQRITLPSEDAPAALRAISLQGLLQRQTQLATNVQTSQSYLTATDSALASVANTVSELRSAATAVAGSTSSDAQRAAAGAQITNALQQLVNTANQQFRGRYLFSGSQNNTPPFQLNGNNVTYNGNSADLQSLADQNFLFSTNVTGDQAFGAFSPPVKGADLNPIITNDTKLSDLRGGQGVPLGSIAISDGTHSSTIDLSKAETIGDVVSIIQQYPPAGRTLNVAVTASGINVSLDAAGGGQLAINEVNGGLIATDLGILNTVGTNTGPVVGADLNPRIGGTTPLSSLLGTRSKVDVLFAGSNNDLHFESVNRGVTTNGVTVSFVNNNAIIPGSETVAYNSGTNTLTFQVKAGATTANDIVHALNNDPVAGLVFQSSLISKDTAGVGGPGSGLVDTAASGVTSGGGGIEPDFSHGLKITNGGQTYNIDLSSAKTAEDALNLLNGSPAGVLAQINAAGNGIDVRSRVSGGDFSIGENGGQTATQLGLRTFTSATLLTSLNHGVGVHENLGADFTIQRKDGSKLTYDVAGLKTVGDVLNLINNDPNNQNPVNKVTAQLATNGNGIELVTSDPSNTAQFSVSKVSNSQAAEDLGLIPIGKNISTASVAGVGQETITGRDVNPSTVGGIFDSLLRARQALTTNNSVGLQFSLSQLETSTTQLQFTQAEVGSRQQSLDALQTRQDSQTIELKSSLSNEIDTDVAQASIDLQGKQASFAASLKVAAVISQLTLLNYL